MNLYHFTSHIHFPYIEADGLTRGDVPLTNSPVMGELAAVWLTDNPKPHHQQWSKTHKGIGVNKRGWRLTVKVDEADPLLVKWTDFYHRFRLDLNWMEALNRAGGGGAENWWLYFGVIEPGKIIEKRVLSQKSAHDEAMKKILDGMLENRAGNDFLDVRWNVHTIALRSYLLQRNQIPDAVKPGTVKPGDACDVEAGRHTADTEPRRAVGVIGGGAAGRKAAMATMMGIAMVAGNFDLHNQWAKNQQSREPEDKS